MLLYSTNIPSVMHAISIIINSRDLLSLHNVTISVLSYSFLETLKKNAYLISQKVGHIFYLHLSQILIIHTYLHENYMIIYFIC